MKAKITFRKNSVVEEQFRDRTTVTFSVLPDGQRQDGRSSFSLVSTIKKEIYLPIDSCGRELTIPTLELAYIWALLRWGVLSELGSSGSSASPYTPPLPHHTHH